jgi:subfamily B ATP-binding cassette protein MsbA
VDAKPHGIKLIGRLFLRARRHAGWILLTMVCMALYSALFSGRTYILKPLFDGVLLEQAINEARSAKDAAGQRWDKLLEILYIVAALTPFLVLFDYLQEYLFRLTTMKIIVDFRNQIMAHLVRLSMRFFGSRHTGDLISRLSNDVNVTQAALDFFFGDIVLQTFMLIGVLALAIYTSWQMSLIVFIGFPLFIWPLVVLGKRIRRSRRHSLERLGDLTQSMHQMFSGIRIVKSFEMEGEEVKVFEERNDDFFRQSMKVARAKALSASVMQLLEAFIMLAIFVVGGFYVVKARPENGISTGAFVTFIVACISMNRPLKVLGKAYSSLQEAIAACERVFELMDIPPEIQDAPDAVDLPRIERGVRFEKVTFAYETEPVLRDIALEARPGQIVALVGPSGGGKSTLCDLLCRFYDPQAGAITLDGLDLRKIRNKSLLGHIAVVSQETFLFHATIGENIRYGKRAATDGEVAEAARAANIHDFIDSLPEGYRTLVGERGARLSGGQRQRIAIARAILKDPALLILDEATSALDTENERLVQEALNRLMISPTRSRQGRITFVIAHRLSTVQRADRIVALDAGRIVEQGTHDELLRLGGLYERLYRLQFQMAEADG